jgi:tetratricopeptide (TPR) repeat protein
MIEADEEIFLDIVWEDEKEASPSEKPYKDFVDELASGDSDPALVDLALYGMFIESDPEAIENVEDHVSRAELMLERGFHDRAIQDLRMALRLDIDAQAAWYHMGRAYEMKGKIETAKAAYEGAIELAPETEVGIAAKWDQEVLRLAPQDERASVVSALGMPDAFTLIMIESEPSSRAITRYETWYYYRAATRFEFVNGKAVTVEDIEDVDFNTVEAIFPPYRPYQFLSGLSFEDVTDMIGEQDYPFYELGDNPLEDGELVYTRQLALGFKGGGLFYVRTIPLFTDE